MDSQYRRSVAHASAVLPELQDGASPLSAVVRERSDSRSAHGACEHACVKKARSMSRSATSTRLCLGEGWRRADWADATRKRRENHGDCRSSWLAAGGDHARREPSRSHTRAADVRLLHDRSEAGEPDRRSSAYDSDQLDEQMRPQGTEMISPHRNKRVRARRRTVAGCAATSAAGSSSASLPGFNGNVGSWFAGNTTRPISSASCSLQPYASCSSNFEIGSRKATSLAISSVRSHASFHSRRKYPSSLASECAEMMGKNSRQSRICWRIF